MAVVALTATRRGVSSTKSHGLGGNVKVEVATVEVGSSDSATSTYALFNIPTNARLLGASKAYWDDLASTGSPTLDFGLFAVKGNVTDDDDALVADKDAATANATGAPLIADIASYGKRAWELVSGVTADPGGSLLVKATLKDAAVNVGGTLTVELYYEID